MPVRTPLRTSGQLLWASKADSSELPFVAMHWIPSCSRTRVWEGRELGEEGQGQELNTGIYELLLAAWGRGLLCQNNI